MNNQIFLLASEPRTGSNYFLSHLQDETVPIESIRQEIFNSGSINNPSRNKKYDIIREKLSHLKTAKDVSNYIDEAFQIIGYYTDKKTIIKCHIHDLSKPIQNWVIENEVPILRLTRKSYIEQYYSRLVAMKYNKWKNKTGETNFEESVDIEDFESWLQHSINYSNSFNETFKDHKIHYFQYEDITDSKNFWNDIYDFLDLDFSEIPTPINKTKKQRTKPIQNLITNYEKVCEILIKKDLQNRV